MDGIVLVTELLIGMEKMETNIHIYMVDRPDDSPVCIISIAENILSKKSNEFKTKIAPEGRGENHSEKRELKDVGKTTSTEHWTATETRKWNWRGEQDKKKTTKSLD